MKKIIVLLTALLICGAVASAQPRAAGVRAGYGVDLSYQHYLGDNFAEFDLGFGFGRKGFVLTGLYDFIIASAGSVNVYAGPGAQVGIYNKVNAEGNKYWGLDFGLAGQIGAEYQFSELPLNISLDWRPVFNFLGQRFGWDSLCLGIRYSF